MTSKPLFGVSSDNTAITLLETKTPGIYALNQALHYRGDFVASFHTHCLRQDIENYICETISELVKAIYSNDPVQGDRYVPWLDFSRIPYEVALEWQLIRQCFTGELHNFIELKLGQIS